MDSREERLQRMRAGMPVRNSGRKLSDAAIMGVSASNRGAGSGANFELSDNAAKLIAKAVKTLLNS